MTEYSTNPLNIAKDALESYAAHQDAATAGSRLLVDHSVEGGQKLLTDHGSEPMHTADVDTMVPDGVHIQVQQEPEPPQSITVHTT